MVKMLVLIFAVALAVGLSEAGSTTPEDAKKLLTATVKKCADETEASQEDVKKFKEHEVPETHAGKCMAACIFKAFGVFQDGKYVAEAVVRAGKSLYGEESEHLEKIKSIAETCEKEVSVATEDECEMAAKTIACETPLIKAAGIPLLEY